MTRFLPIALFVCGAFSSALHGQTFFATADARVIGTSGFDTTNFGGEGHFNAFRIDGQPNLQYSLVLFDVSSLNGQTIANATLTLTTDANSGENNGNFGGRPTNIFRVGQSWTENGVTWSTRDGSSNWTSAGGDFLGTGGAQLASPFATDTTVVGPGEVVQMNFDVTALVQGWLSSTYTNFGFGVAPGVDLVALGFYSHEAGGLEQPTLSVAFAPIPEPSTYAAIFGLLALGAVGVRRCRRRS